MQSTLFCKVQLVPEKGQRAVEFGAGSGSVGASNRKSHRHAVDIPVRTCTRHKGKQANKQTENEDARAHAHAQTFACTHADILVAAQLQVVVCMCRELGE